MTETTVSASHFRVHFKEIANSVARGEQACTVERHGLPVGVLVSEEDAEFLRKHKWGTSAAQAKPDADTIALIDPDSMPIELVEEAYDLTSGTTDFEIQGWRYKAYFSIKGRTGKNPPRPFEPSG
jgi:prevent-host-death family protein